MTCEDNEIILQLSLIFFRVFVRHAYVCPIYQPNKNETGKKCPIYIWYFKVDS